MSVQKTALIFGVTGQDGAYLSHALLQRGYVVHGTSRDREMANTDGLRQLEISNQVQVHSAVPSDFRSVLQVIETIAPDHIYNLAGQSSVGLSFQQPLDTVESITMGMLNILEVIRFRKAAVRLYNAASSETFGNTDNGPADETTAFRPRSPYGVAKAASFWTVANYRECYNLFACSGILFNHESPLRPQRFVTQKIIRGAVDIAQRKVEHLMLGNIDVTRDWGWASDYVDAMVRILEHETPHDYVIATGIPSTLADFVAAAFAHVGLAWRKHVEMAEELRRPTDISMSVGNAAKAKRLLDWRADITMPKLVGMLVDAELERRARKE